MVYIICNVQSALGISKNLPGHRYHKPADIPIFIPRGMQLITQMELMDNILIGYSSPKLTLKKGGFYPLL
jgi:hypothetical protein